MSPHEVLTGKHNVTENYVFVVPHPRLSTSELRASFSFGLPFDEGSRNTSVGEWWIDSLLGPKVQSEPCLS